MTPPAPGSVAKYWSPDDRPVPMLLGLFVGIQSLVLCFGFFWPIAWVFPAILGAVTYPRARTRQFALGSFAAACGAAVAVLTAFILAGF